MLFGLFARESLPYEMFDVMYTDREARRAKRMESIYHVGQDRIWDGRKVLSELIDRHGRPKLAARERQALSQIFSVIMWGELAAWKISKSSEQSSYTFVHVHMNKDEQRKNQPSPVVRKRS